ncbi:hypothetical protein A3Q56_01129 [Intoshia linei]|uniref:Serpin domain-containing protein n=1 Tax=Intoshia linei TaxID=1819745 RepID=A0A177BCA0_9BILA|nr:hypothetical protein A3Q56_01129 [Intoshia linei]
MSIYDDLMKINVDKRKGVNLLFSPVAMEVILKMIDSNLSESNNPFLKYKNFKDSTKYANFYEYLKKNQDVNKFIKMGTKVFYSHETKLKDNVDKIVDDALLTRNDYEMINFGNDRIGEIITNYVYHVTAKRIDSTFFMHPLWKEVRIFVINALQLSIPFNCGFEKCASEKFYLFNNKEINVQMMSCNKKIKLIKYEKKIIVQIPLSVENFNMVIVLSKDSKYVFNTSEVLNAVEKEKEFKNIALYLPIFSLDSNINIEQSLIDIGFKGLFGSMASNLLNSSEQLYISSIMHMTNMNLGINGINTMEKKGECKVNMDEKFCVNSPFYCLVYYLPKSQNAEPIVLQYAYINKP